MFSKPANSINQASAKTAVEESVSPVMLSVPLISSTSTPSAVPPSAADLVKIALPRSNPLQSAVQGARQRFIDVARGAFFWRLFVGSGTAILLGAVVLVCFSPDHQPSRSTHNDSGLNQSGQPSSTQSAQFTTAGPAIELTVHSNESGRTQSPAEFDDPFRVENLVQPKVVHADHRQSANLRAVVRPVSHTSKQPKPPVWLSGDIEVEDSVSPPRKHERTRPSHR